jgi:hypothetical protein
MRPKNQIFVVEKIGCVWVNLEYPVHVPMFKSGFHSPVF